MKRFLLSMLAITVFYCGAAQANDDKLTIAFKWNPVERAWSLREVFHNCMKKDHVCRAVVETVGAEVGIPPGAIRESMRIADKLGLGTGYRNPGEEHYYLINVPKGYRACDMGFYLTSLAPLDGNKTPTFQAAVHADNVIEIYSFVHRLGIGAGRSWVDGNIAIQLAKIGSRAERTCYMKSKQKYVYRCKGRGCGTVPLGRMPEFN